MTDEPIVTISAIEHFVYCPRQCALIHCDGVWSDNAQTVRGSRAHRRVDSGRHRRERGRLVLRSLPLWSETLGLSGRADAVEIEPGVVRPVEYKSGIRHGAAAAARTYFGAVAQVVSKSDIGFSKRTRRPPRDPVNAMLGFCYGLLVTEFIGAVESVGLDYQMGFFHRPRSGRPSLALDLAEELRALTDRFVVSLVRRR